MRHPPTSLPQHYPLCRAERILCTALDEEDEASKPTAACWVGGRANCFAVGYDDGSILVWGVPPVALQGELWQELLGSLFLSRTGPTPRSTHVLPACRAEV